MDRSRGHIVGLNTIRFVAAVWVAFSHGASLPLREMFPDKTQSYYVLIGLHNVAFNGFSAVIVFFLVSGLCIHLPYAASSKLNIQEFLARRYLRIGPPLAVASIIMLIPGRHVEHREQDVLWSIYCEIIYYTLYPMLFMLFKKVGVLPTVIAAYVVSYTLFSGDWSNIYIWQWGDGFTWLFCLPYWLLGCLLAERIAAGKLSHLRGNIWIWRFVAWVYTSGQVVLVFHSPITIGYPFTTGPFACFAFFWVQKELQHFAKQGCPSWLERAGEWSYSVYLVHNMVIGSVSELHLALHPLVVWAVQLVLIFALSYLFFVVVERPSHHLARKFGSLLSTRSVVPT